jgi:pimeloyl-ACP methyl ester carboxylesterase
LLAAIRVPTLLVIGDAPVVSMEVATELQGLTSGLRIEQVEQAGHGVPYDQPERLASIVRAFLLSIASAQ